MFTDGMFTTRRCSGSKSDGKVTKGEVTEVMFEGLLLLAMMWMVADILWTYVIHPLYIATISGAFCS